MKIKIQFVILFLINSLFAHPSPNTLMFVDIKSNGVAAELRLPVGELGMALNPKEPKIAEQLLGGFTDSLKIYLLSHIKPLSMDGQKWSVEIGDMRLENVADVNIRGTLQDIIVKIWLKPPTGASSRQFILDYDVILHQVVTHNAIVSIRQDWEAGVIAEHPVEVGVIAVDPRDNTITPLSINQIKGGLWGGFKGMTRLGMRHIAEGTDHLMFLLVLLMAAPLLPAGKRWGAFGGMKYSLIRLIKIITAFTIGHSITLLIGAIGWVKLPNQPIEVLIAFSILISAIHAIRPIFPQKEAYMAIGFGLIHGLAFASTLSNLNLPTTQMTLSILGFNVGIELMQLMVIALIVPWLIILSKGSYYTSVRAVGATYAGVVALAWMMERIVGQPNVLSVWASKFIEQAPYFILVLALAALVSFWFERNETT